MRSLPTFLIPFIPLVLGLAACSSPSPAPSPAVAETAPPGMSTALTPTMTQTPAPTPTLDPHWRIDEASMPGARSETGAAVIDGKIYVPGGMTGFRYNGSAVIGLYGTEVLAIYDLASGTWSTGAAMPYPGLNHAAVAAYDGKLYTFGGVDEIDVRDFLTLIYDPASDSWSEGPPLPLPRQGAAAVVLDDYIYVVGGDGSDSTNHLLRFDPRSGEWTQLAGMQQYRGHIGAVALNGRIYAMGGRWQNRTNDSIVDERTMEIYDPATDTWGRGPSMNHERAGFARAVIDGKIYVAGGELLSMFPNQIVGSVEMFDPAANKWVEIGEMPQALHGVSGLGIDGEFYLLAGSTHAGAVSPSGRIMIYTP